jgi:hypothetical protein
MAGENQIGDHRFEGFSNDQLAREVELLGNGPGPGSLYRAVDALKYVAETLSETDRVMRDELAKIGVEWESETAEDAQVQMTDAASYGGGAAPTITASGQAVSAQGDSYSRTTHAAPTSSTLRGSTDLSMGDKVAGFFGHTTDHAQEVARTNAARDHAVELMNGYTTASHANLTAYSSLAVPPGFSLESQTVGGPGVNSTPGPNLGQGGGPAPGGGLPLGAPGAPGTPAPPGKLIGAMPFGAAPAAGGIPGLPGGLRPNLTGIGEAAALAGLAGTAGGAAGAGVRKDQLARGGGRGIPVDASGRSGSSGGRPIGTPPVDDAAAARTAERVGSKSRPGATMMQPAVAGASARDEDDDDHVRKYGVEADDVFADERLVMQSVLGEDEDDEEEK